MTNEKHKDRWLWYPGDFEIRHGLLQNFQREERGFDWPAYWYMDDCHRNVKFKRYYFLDQPSMFKVTIQGVGYVEINGQKHPCGKWLTCPAGKAKIRIFVGHTSGLPAMFIEGDEVKSDIGWTASNFIEEYPAGWSPLYVDIAKDPNQIYYQKECVHPVTETEIGGGILFDFANKDQQQSILKNVLLNDTITQITTPYFKFYEQDALCKLGQTNIVYQTILDYWGGMLSHDAVTFWEEYDPTQTGNEKYSMYGDPYGKSLCHAWGASPIYLLGRYFIGLYPTKPGYEEFMIQPNLDSFETLNCTLPIKDGKISLEKTKDKIVITSDRTGGTVKMNGKSYPLLAKQPLVLTSYSKINA